MASLRIIYASTSGNTEFVVDRVVQTLRHADPTVDVTIKRAEQATADDLLKGDALVLASGTWNTGGKEGQLHEFMHTLLYEKAKDLELKGRPIAFISLGDSRYYFTTRCTEYFQRFRMAHGASQLLPPFILVNEPYDQVAKIDAWATKLLQALKNLPIPTTL